MQISYRLTEIISMVTKGLITADVGTDHGYVPITLVESGISPSAIAMDVNKGPLLKAEKNVQDAGLSDRISLRLSDGLEKLAPGEAECVVISGMGGLLIKRILSSKPDTVSSLKEMVLSPQSDIDEVRRYLLENDFLISDEKMLVDEGKYYTIIKAQKGKSDTYSRAELKFGRCLLERRDETLLGFLTKEKKVLEGISENLKRSSTDSAVQRLEELKEELSLYDEALSCFESYSNEKR